MQRALKCYLFSTLPNARNETGFSPKSLCKVDGAPSRCRIVCGLGECKGLEIIGATGIRLSAIP